MTEGLRIASADVVRHGVLQVRWADGTSGLVDLKGIIARGGVFAFLSRETAFAKVSVSVDGRGVQWTDPDGDIISIASDALAARLNVVTDLAA